MYILYTCKFLLAPSESASKQTLQLVIIIVYWSWNIETVKLLSTLHKSLQNCGTSGQFDVELFQILPTEVSFEVVANASLVVRIKVLRIRG